MSSNTTSSNLTAAFVDLATYDEPEKYFYGGTDAVTYFVKKLRKSTWFSVAPTVLSISGGNPGFNQSWGYKISRAGDYLLRTWLRIQLPAVKLAGSYQSTITVPSTLKGGVWPFQDCSLRWTHNLGHNLIKEINISFNDLVAERMDSFYLDFWAAFTVPAGKRNGYDNMVGNIPTLVNPCSVLSNNDADKYNIRSLPPAILDVPLPFFYARDTGIALPTAAIPYNDMVHYVTFRDISEVLMIDNINWSTAVPPATLGQYTVPCQRTYLTEQNPQLNVDMWAEYAIVSNVERTQMGKAPRDILIEQVQTAPRTQYIPSNVAQTDIRFAHSIKALFFAVRNKTVAAEWSNYTAAQPVPYDYGLETEVLLASDPIRQTSLLYENTARLVNMGSDYFSLIVPWYTAVSIPTETGYHLLSYTLDLVNTNPMGSTNYGKLTNVSFQFGASEAAVTSSQATSTMAFSQAGAPVAQIFETLVVGLNMNIIRISGGKNVPSTVDCSMSYRNSLMEENSVKFCHIYA
jgi:hypothetical protein